MLAFRWFVRKIEIKQQEHFDNLRRRQPSDRARETRVQRAFERRQGKEEQNLRIIVSYLS